MMKNKGKRLVVLLIAACMILSMFSGMTVSAATDAEIYATTNTIKKDDEKYYYVNASGKTDTPFTCWTNGGSENSRGRTTAACL